MPNSENFEKAVVRSREITTRPANNDLLMLYALFKQATEGDVTGSRPSGFDFKGAAKFDAWASKKGTSKENAEAEYVALVARLQAGA